MKYLKLQKTDYKDLVYLLHRAGLVSGNNAEPSRLLVNPTDYKKLKYGAQAQFQRAYPNLSKRMLAYSVGAYLLNLAPIPNKAVRPGYALILETPNANS